MAAPQYQGLVAADFPSASLPGEAGSVRVIGGEFEGAKGPARTFTPIKLFDLRLRAGKSLRLRLGEGWSAALFVLDGKVNVNTSESAEREELVVLERAGDEVLIQALT